MNVEESVERLVSSNTSCSYENEKNLSVFLKHFCLNVVSYGRKNILPFTLPPLCEVLKPCYNNGLRHGRIRMAEKVGNDKHALFSQKPLYP